MKIKVGPYYFKLNHLALTWFYFCCFVFWISPYTLYQKFKLLFIPESALEIYQGLKNVLLLSLRITNPLNFFFIYFFICAGSSLLLRLFSNCGQRGLLSSCSVQASRCGSFSCCAEHKLLGTQASTVLAHELSSCGCQALEHRVNSCDTRAYLPLGMWDLPRPGFEPWSPASAGGFFFTTEPPGKPLEFCCSANVSRNSTFPL